MNVYSSGVSAQAATSCTRPIPPLDVIRVLDFAYSMRLKIGTEGVSEMQTTSCAPRQRPRSGR